MIEKQGLTGMNRVSSAAATTMSRITTRIKLAMPQRNNPLGTEDVLRGSPGISGSDESFYGDEGAEGGPRRRSSRAEPRYSWRCAAIGRHGSFLLLHRSRE